jgi:hypothetical protein
MKLNVITEVILRTSEEICLDIIAEHNLSKRPVLILKSETDIDFKLCDYFFARERGHCHISRSSFIIHSEFRRLETVSIMCLNACYILLWHYVNFAHTNTLRSFTPLLLLHLPGGNICPLSSNIRMFPLQGLSTSPNCNGPSSL